MRIFFLICAAAAPFMTGCKKQTSLSSAPGSGSVVAAEGPAWFEEITEQSGIRFTHQAPTNYFMPDQVGSGIALFDYDNDGKLDVYLVQNSGTNQAGSNRLFHQDQDGTFRDVSQGSGLDITGRGMGAFAGDVNNDGLPDLLVTEYGAVHLFMNTGSGKFREVTREAGLDNPRWAAPASFLDFDRDGRLDLVVGNYVDYDPTHICHDVQGRQDFCAPQAFADTVTRIWRNVTPKAGDVPKFEDRTESSGLTRAPGAALGLICADFDGDGWPDIFCSDDGRPNRLFINRHNGTFTEEAAARGLAFNAMGGTAANMGTAYGDVDGDGLGDVFVTHLTEEFHGLWKQSPRGIFSDAVASVGLQQQTWRGTGFGVVLADLDCDGSVDLAFVNGLVRRAVPGHTPVVKGVAPWWTRYAQKAQIFANDGSGRFRDISGSNPAFCGQAMVGRSLAIGDLNNDGALDLIACGSGGPALVFRNVNPNRGHWVRLRLVDTQHGGRDAIGAEVTVAAGGKRWWTVLQPATSYLVSNDPVVHFGLGKVQSVDSFLVLWPDGTKETFPGAPANQLLTLRKGEGQKVTL
jgi:hypothetical protein